MALAASTQAHNGFTKRNLISSRPVTRKCLTSIVISCMMNVLKSPAHLLICWRRTRTVGGKRDLSLGCVTYTSLHSFNTLSIKQARSVYTEENMSQKSSEKDSRIKSQYSSYTFCVCRHRCICARMYLCECTEYIWVYLVQFICVQSVDDVVGMSMRTHQTGHNPVCSTPFPLK